MRETVPKPNVREASAGIVLHDVQRLGEVPSGLLVAIQSRQD